MLLVKILVPVSHIENFDVYSFSIYVFSCISLKHMLGQMQFDSSEPSLIYFLQASIQSMLSKSNCLYTSKICQKFKLDTGRHKLLACQQKCFKNISKFPKRFPNFQSSKETLIFNMMSDIVINKVNFVKAVCIRNILWEFSIFKEICPSAIGLGSYNDCRRSNVNSTDHTTIKNL